MYEPDVLSTVHRALQRQLSGMKCGHNILRDKDFERSRAVLASLRKKLKKQGLGNKPNASRELNEAEMLKLFDQNFFGSSSPESVQRTVWWYVSINFGFRGRDEQRQLCWGDVSVEHDPANGHEYLQWHKQRTRKKSQGIEGESDRACDGRMYETKGQRCPMYFFRMFAKHRPANACTPESPFFLQLMRNVQLSDAVWFTKRPVGKNTLGNILTEARKQFGLAGRKVSNHSVRKTGITRLMDGNVPETLIAQHSGMSSTESLKCYKQANAQQQARMSNLLCLDATDAPGGSREQAPAAADSLVPFGEDEIEIDQIMSAIPDALPLASSANGVFSGAILNNCTINLTFNVAK